MSIQDSGPTLEGLEQRPSPEGVFEIGPHKIFCADCLSCMRGLQSEVVDVVITSPPYNIGLAYKSYDDRRPRLEYLEWITKVAVEIKRVLREDGSFFLNIGTTAKDPWIAMDIAAAFRSYFQLQNQIVWVKTISVDQSTHGHFKPINSHRYLNYGHEVIFHFTKTGNVSLNRLAVGVPFKDKTNIARWHHSVDKRCAGNVWFIPYATVYSRRQKFGHPAGFPVELPKRCIQLHDRRDAIVLDPFLGTGTTLLAAHQLGMKGIGIEIDKDYVEAARHRLEDAVGQGSFPTGN